MESQENLFISACGGNDIERVKELLNKNNKINIHYRKERAIRLSCYNGNTTIVKLLLDYGIEHKSTIDMNVYGTILFIIAFRQNKINIVHILLEYCEKYKYNVVVDYLILTCVKLILPDILTVLLDYRCRIKIPFDIKKNETDIYNSAHYNNTTSIVFKILFEYGEKINYKLNIYKIYTCKMLNFDEYLINLSKHNYSQFNIYKCNKNGIYCGFCYRYCIRKRLEFNNVRNKYIYYNNIIYNCSNIDSISTMYCCKLYNMNYILFFTYI